MREEMTDHVISSNERSHLRRLGLTEAARQKILDPEPGSALARARDYGIDLTLILRNVTLSPQALLENAVRAQVLVRLTRRLRERDDGN